MFGQFYAGMRWSELPLLALLLFLTVFIVVTVRTLFGRGLNLDAVARLPLEDDGDAEKGRRS